MARSSESEKQKKSIQRIVVSQNPCAPIGYDAALRKIKAALVDASSAIDKTLRTLVKDAQGLGVDVPTVSIKIFRDGDQLPTVGAIIDNTIEQFRDRDSSKLVAIIYYTDVLDDLPYGFSEATTGRFLMGIRAHLPHDQKVDNVGWRRSDGGLSSLISVSAESLPSLLEDLLIDFALSNAQPWVDLTHAIPASAFGKMKLSFAESENQRCFFGAYDRDANYACFASCARQHLGHNRGDLKRAITLWQSFTTSALVARLADVDEVVDEILQRHRHGGSISPRELKRSIADLTSGHYHLVMTTNRPKRTKDRDRIAGMCGFSSWHQYSWTIFPASRFSEISKDVRDGHFSALAFAL